MLGNANIYTHMSVLIAYRISNIVYIDIHLNLSLHIVQNMLKRNEQDLIKYKIYVNCI